MADSGANEYYIDVRVKRDNDPKSIVLEAIQNAGIHVDDIKCLLAKEDGVSKL